MAAAAALTVMCTQAPELPESLKGTWSGEIEDLGLTLTLHLGDTCTVDSPDQEAYGFKAVVKKAGQESLSVKFPEFHASFEGRVQGDSLIGRFSQMGLKKQLRMGRGELVRLRPQTPEGPFPYTTEEVTFNNADISLSGTLCLPEAIDAPAVVMVSGSGKQDRDESLMGHKPFAVLSDALAREGIPSLRYDDRECGGSTGVFADATTADFAQDAASAVQFLRSRGFSKVGVLGHSEGGTIAMMLAGAEEPAEGAPDFIVSLAGMADRGDSTLMRQMIKTFIQGGAPEKAASFAAKISYKKTVKMGGKWMESFVALDPAPYIARIKCPVLALNGEKDCQVIPEYNLSKIEALCPGADCRLYPGLNHLFQHCKTGLGTEYAKIEETMSEDVIRDITEWIKKL